MTLPTARKTGRRCLPSKIRLIVIAPLLLLCPSARAVTYTNQTVSAQAPPATGCVVPPSKSSFLTTDGTAYLYFEATVAPSDALTSDWLAPDGTSVAPSNWDASTGDFCFTGASFSISSLPASQLGSWQARVFDNGNILFSVPFTVGAPAVSGVSYYFPQLAFGGGFQTTLTYVNYSPQSVSCQTTFYSDAGGALQVPFPGGPVSQRTDTFAAGADIHVETNAAAGSQNQGGWAVAQCSAPVKASLLYREYSGGVPQGEASVNATTTPTTEFVTFAQTYTGVAYANPSATAANVTLKALSSGGSLLGTTSFALAPKAHGAANIGPLLGLNSFTGSIQITSTVPIVSLSLNAEDFPVFSSLPPGDLPAGTALAPGNGGGGGTGTPVITSFTASPLSIQAGQSSTLSWSVQNATSLSINNGIGTVSGSSISVSPRSTTAYTLTASNANGPTLAFVTVTVSGGGGPSPISITSFSNTSPLPFSPLTINTSGISPSSPVNVSFTDNAGYTVTTAAVAVSAGGGVMLATPLYVNTRSGQIGPGAVSVTVSQGAATSTAVSLNIQDVPPLSTYGTNLGQISHAVLVLDASLIAQRINQLQAYQSLPGNSINTTAAQNTLNTLLNSVIQARSDVDNVMQNHSYVVSIGTRPNGTAIQFDQNSLDMMDRIHALFPMQTLATLPASTASAQSARARRARAILIARRRAASRNALTAFSARESLPLGLGKTHRSRPRQSDSESQPRTNSKAEIETLLGVMEATGGTIDLSKGAQKAQGPCTDPSTCWSTQLQGVAQTMSGANGVLNSLLEPTGSTKLLSQSIGMVGAVVQDIQVVGDVAAQLWAFTEGEITGNQALVDVAVQAMDANQSKALGAAADLSIALLGGPGFSEAAQQASTTLGFINTLISLGEPAEEAANEVPGQFAAEVQSMPNISMDFGTLYGTVDIANSNGITSAQTGLDLQGGPSDLNTLGDPSGDYQILVPLNVPGFDYSGASIVAYDPISEDYISDETVNIAALSPTNSLTLPTFSGECDDDDSTDPDSDDPDCD